MSKTTATDRDIGSETSLTLGDTRVTGSDIRLIKNNDWISDSIVAFYFEYLNSRVFTSYKCSLCIQPDVTGLIQITPAKDLGVFLEPLDIDQKDLILLPLHRSVDEREDHYHIHWSLLVYSKFDKKIFHFDPQNGYNKVEASNFAVKLSAYFGNECSTDVNEVTCVQQSQPQESGLIMLANAEQVITYAAKSRTVENCPQVSEKDIKNFGKKTLKLIWKLKHSSSVYQIKSKNETSLFSKSFHEEHDRDRY